MSESAAEAFRIHLPQFDGPFDLLLFFIERDELDIYDIPIARITQDFLAYIKVINQMNIELASEFILVAGTLMRIKAKMLLPRKEVDESGKEIDPRQELVDRLLEYKRYKDVLESIAQLETAQSERVHRGNVATEAKLISAASSDEEMLDGLDMFTLMRTFKRIWERHQDQLRKPRHVIRQYPYKVEEVKDFLLERLEYSPRVDFMQLALERKELIFAVFCFLAILEMVQTQVLTLTVGEGYNNFWVEKKAAPAA